MPWRVAPQVRLELTTLRLTAECSAIELLRIIRGLRRDSFGCPAVCLSASGALRLALAHAPASHCASASRSPRPASARRPVLPYVLGAGKTFVPPAPLGSRQLPTLPSRSQLSTISVWRLNFCVRYGYRWCPPAIVTGNFPQGSFSLAPHSPHLQNCTAIELTRKHSLFQISSVSSLRALYGLRSLASSASFAFSLTAFLLRSSPRPISIAKLHASQRFHRRPIYLIVSEGSYLL